MSHCISKHGRSLHRLVYASLALKVSPISTSCNVQDATATGSVCTEIRTFSQQDVLIFTNLTSDVNGIHVDKELAKKAGFPKQIVPGILIASLFPSAISKRYPGAVYMSQTLKFRHYAMVGDRLRAEVSVQRKIGRHATFNTVCTIDDEDSPSHGQIVLEGQAMARI